MKPDLALMGPSERKVVNIERQIKLHEIYYDEFELQVARHGYKGLLSEHILKEEVDRVPIDCRDFDKPGTITHRFLFHPLVFTGEPTFRFNTRNLLMFGFLHCTHRSHQYARDSLWGLMNPQLQPTVARATAKEFLLTLVRMATVIPDDYLTVKYSKRKDQDKVRGHVEFIKEVNARGQGTVLNQLFMLPDKFSREQFDQVFDS